MRHPKLIQKCIVFLLTAGLALSLCGVNGGVIARAEESDEESLTIAAENEGDGSASDTSEDADEANVAAEETIAYPAFNQETIIDSTTIRVQAEEGVFPEGATLFAEHVKDEVLKADIHSAITEERNEAREHVASSYTFDIKVISKDGKEIQPAEGGKVQIFFTLEEVAEHNLDATVYHIEENETYAHSSAEMPFVVETLDIVEGSAANGAETSDGAASTDTITVETEGFSYYTVEFTYGDLQYVLPGDTSVPLADILEAVGLVGTVEYVEVSNPALFSASDESGEWVISANEAFTSEEWMRVAIGGFSYDVELGYEPLESAVHTIRVTDSQSRTLSISITTQVAGTDWDSGMSFTYTLTPVSASDGRDISSIPAPSSSSATATENNPTITFSGLTFTEEDVGVDFIYTYTLEEPTFAGYDASEWELVREYTLTVTPIITGSLQFEIDGGYVSDNIRYYYVQRYKSNTDNTYAEFFARKQVVDREGNPYWPEGVGEFVFYLETEMGANTNDRISRIPMPSISIHTGRANRQYKYSAITVSDTSVVSFGTVDFYSEYQSLNANESKTITYYIGEDILDAPGITYDWNSYTVEVTIAKDGDGNIIPPDVQYYDPDGNVIDVDTDGYPLITNTYKATGETTLSLTKELNGRALTAKEFSFSLYDNAGNPLYLDGDGLITTNANDGSGTAFTKISGSNASDGSVHLGPLTFTEIDAQNSPCTFIVREDIPAGAVAQDNSTLSYSSTTTLAERDAHTWIKDGIIYDSTPRTVSITLADNGQGVILVTQDAATADSPLSFTNTYQSTKQLTISKTVTGNMADLSRTFDFTATIPALADKTVDGITFDASGNGIFSLGNGETKTITDIPKNAAVAVAETDYTSQGYTTSYAVDGGASVNDRSWNTTALSEDTEIAFTNDKTAPVPTGIFTDSTPWAKGFMAGISLSAFWLAVLFRRRRNYREDW